jgi:maltose alpha-D-glucosyltransferase/alpha-amylase
VRKDGSGLAEQPTQTDAPPWYKDAVVYELPVRAFYDGNGDGIGDFPGLTHKLDYLRELGVTALWLLPFYPSPLLDDGYDIADYLHIHPDYGSLSDFRRFLREAHKRNIRVITELVINHTSNQHAWFKRARYSRPGSLWRDFYVWSDTPDKYKDARIIFTDFEKSNWTWDDVAHAYYWHRFYSHQPDLNYDNPRVRQEVLRVLDYWFAMGVDGMRLDAVPYLFEREGTNCENLPETHAFLKELRAHVDARFKDRMLLAEANQWPQDAAAYFGAGDECHMAFHFPIMPRLFMAVRMEDRFPIIDILEQSLDIPPGCQWGMFLRNHDELTLEMVTDEERDYMYRAYAQDLRARINVGIRRRLAPLLENNRRLIELMNSLLLSLPGTPILYYGDEIGMGDNYHLGDRNGVRTPMQWSAGLNAGFSTANPQQLYLPLIIDPEYHYMVVNVENQSHYLSSLLWFMRQMIAVRKQFAAFGRGAMQFLPSDNNKVLTFLRTWQQENILVAANLSRQPQAVHIQIPDHVGYQVREVFSDNAFPPATEQPYLVTLPPHSFYWFALEPPPEITLAQTQQHFEIQSDVTWDELLGSSAEPLLLEALQPYLRRARWFAGKNKTVHALHLAGHLTLPTAGGSTYILLLEVTYADSPPDRYIVPIGLAGGELQARIMKEWPENVIASLRLPDQEGVLYEAVVNEDLHRMLLDMIARGRIRKMEGGHVIARRGSRFGALLGDKTLPLPSRALKVEQSNTSILYQDTFFLKMYRRIEEGMNPDSELTRHLTEDVSFAHVPAYAGVIRWQRERGSPMTLALLQQFVPNQGDAWSYTLDNIDRSFGHALTLKTVLQKPPEIPAGPSSIEPDAVPTLARDFIGPVYLEMIQLLGQRTGELHLALMSPSQTPDLAPEPFSLLYQKSLYQSIRGLIQKVFSELENNVRSMEPATAEAVRRILFAKRTILNRLARIIERKIAALKIRVHGDYHLGQALYTGKDFVIIDFEGEPERFLTERRLKQSALRDVAGMMRSFHYAAQGNLLLRAARPGTDVDYLRPWADLWYHYVSGVFLHSYRRTVADSPLVPLGEEDFVVLLETFVLEKAVYELGYELHNRPDWLMIPVRGIEEILK